MDYGFYKSAFGGSLIPPELFNRYMYKAKAYLSVATNDRPIPPEYEENAAFALCEIAEVYMKLSSRCGVKSENTDGYSVSYDNSLIKLELSEILNLYLGDSDLLFKGEL
ncbi:MAG: hypothetical protein E7415_05940 [Ruminococcaceae bacterium]|nr:hypothetical protein [Oscillospiraceae bacterium]